MTHLKCLAAWMGCLVLSVGVVWGGELTLTVVDAESGKPIGNASVVTRRDDGGYPAEGRRTAADGECTISTKPGESYVSLLVRHEGHVTTTVTWGESGHDPVTLPAAQVVKLAPCKPISGRILDPDGQPVLDAKVYLKYWPAADSVKERPGIAPRLPDEMVMTDEEGVWSYPGAPGDALDQLSIRVEHPDFVSNGQTTKLRPQALLDGTATIKLDRGVNVTGQVVGSDGKPVAYAHISTQHRYDILDYGVTETADEQGRFSLPHTGPGELPVTVTAPGFTPDLQKVDVKPGMQPLSFKLAPGRPAKGQVVDPSGKPIAGVSVRMRNWRNLIPIPLEATTGRDGRFGIPDAPADEFQVWVIKEGYQRKYDVKLRAGDPEAIIRLAPGAKVKGSVTDAQTGKPVARFKVISGVASAAGRPPLYMFSNAREFTEGRYDYQIEASDQDVCRYLRIDAEGYEPFVSEPITGVGGVIDVKLRPGRPITGIVRNPDGTPLANGDVRCVLPGAQIMIFDGAKGFFATATGVKTDADGRFELSPQTGAFDLLVMADSGCTITPRPAGQNEVELKLSAWSAIEGTYKPTGEAVPQSLSVMVYPPRSPVDAGPHYSWSYSADCDAEGHYRVGRLPCYDGNTVRIAIRPAGGNPGPDYVLPVSLTAGATARVDITAEKAATVTGQVAPAAGQTPLETVTFRDIEITLLDERPPMQWAATMAEAMKSPKPRCRVNLAPDGSFRLPAVPVGRYAYRALVSAGGDNYGIAGGVFDVSQDRIGKTVDLGVIGYTRKTEAKPGQALPEILGAAMPDGKPIRAADLAGKYVVVAIWSSFGQAEADLPELEELGETFGSSSKVALVSLNDDVGGSVSGAICLRPGTLRSQGWLAGYLRLEDAAARASMAGAKYPAFVIAGPDGKIIAARIKSSELADRLKELLKQ